MKTPLLITVFAIMFHLQTQANIIKNLLPFGSKEKIIQIRELPNVNEFKLEDGTYYDVGSLYTKRQFLWLGYSFGEPEYVGFIDSQRKYVPLGDAEFKKIAEIAKIKLPEKAQISFFDRYLSIPILILILLITSIYIIRLRNLRKKIAMENSKEELPAWPPSIQ